LWPSFGGKIYKPDDDKLFYIPQRPYLPSGTLRDQIIYPDSYFEFRKKKMNDNNLRDFLKQVNLLYIEDRYKKDGGFDAVNDWADVLSGTLNFLIFRR
jgi:ATP-binding cassette subfamily D (ALD) protein 3